MSTIEFTYEGIGKLISAGRLRVPVNQREYAREEEHVSALCNDISSSISNGKDGYFLGTVVLTRAANGFLEVVDGQQRLATTTMLFAVLRDMFVGLEERSIVAEIETRFLFGFDLKTEENAPKLQLNTKDHEFYAKKILAHPSDASRKASLPKSVSSNVRLHDAATVLRSYLETSTKALTSSSKRSVLKDWLNFLEEKANLIVLTVPDDVNAYVMFETLNDRGLRVSQADLVKNYLFGQAGSRLDEAQTRWGSMVRSLETVDREDSAIDYLRLLSTIMDGLTRERQVFEKIKLKTDSPIKAISFLGTVDELSSDYVAMLTPDHWKWDDYPESIRVSIATLNLFGVTQIRHLMLAVTHYYGKAETEKAFRLFVDWIVRLFIAGSGRIGRVESIYATLAHDIYNKTGPRTAKLLNERMSQYIAGDRDFEKAFAIAHVSKAKLARYYLEALERTRCGVSLPELVPNKDTKAVNLEHISSAGALRTSVTGIDDSPAYISRLGNLVLLNAKVNSANGDGSFEDKRQSYAESSFMLTRDIAGYVSWGTQEIDSHQEKLAKLAVKTWPMISD